MLYSWAQESAYTHLMMLTITRAHYMVAWLQEVEGHPENERKTGRNSKKIDEHFIMR